jgi:AAA+ superfamily predicted ATPase
MKLWNTSTREHENKNIDAGIQVKRKKLLGSDDEEDEEDEEPTKKGNTKTDKKNETNKKTSDVDMEMFETLKIPFEFLTIEEDYKPFDNVIGYKDVKDELNDIFSLQFKMPMLSNWIGDVRGMLLYGPPGTGKTLLARAFMKMIYSYVHKSKEKLYYRFLIVKASDLSSSFQSVGPQRMAGLFDYMKGKYANNKEVTSLTEQKKYYTVVFVDELEELLKNRTMIQDVSDYSRTVVSFLSEFDSKEERGKFLFIGATNYPWRIDGAAMRRLEKKIFLSLPTPADRAELIQTELVKIAFGAKFVSKEWNDKYIQSLAKKMALYSNDDIVNFFKTLKSVWFSMVWSTEYISTVLPPTERTTRSKIPIKINISTFIGGLVPISDYTKISKSRDIPQGITFKNIIMGYESELTPIHLLNNRYMSTMFINSVDVALSKTKYALIITDYVDMVYYYITGIPPKVINDKLDIKTYLETNNNVSTELLYTILHKIIDDVSNDPIVVESKIIALIATKYNNNTKLHSYLKNLTQSKQLYVIGYDFDSLDTYFE